MRGNWVGNRARYGSERRLMEDDIGGMPYHELGDPLAVSDVLLKKGEELTTLWIGGLLEILDVIPLSGRKIVYSNNSLALLKQGLNKV
jgi:hypothetical protein